MTSTGQPAESVPVQLARMEGKVDRIFDKVDAVGERVNQNTKDIGQNSKDISELRRDVSEIRRDIVNDKDAAADRAVVLREAEEGRLARAAQKWTPIQRWFVVVNSVAALLIVARTFWTGS